MSASESLPRDTAAGAAAGGHRLTVDDDGLVLHRVLRAIQSGGARTAGADANRLGNSHTPLPFSPFSPASARLHRTIQRLKAYIRTLSGHQALAAASLTVPHGSRCSRLTPARFVATGLQASTHAATGYRRQPTLTKPSFAAVLRGDLARFSLGFPGGGLTHLRPALLGHDWNDGQHREADIELWAAQGSARPLTVTVDRTKSGPPQTRTRLSTA